MHPLLDRATPLPRVFDVVKQRWADHQHAEFELSLALRRLYRDNVHRGTTYSNFAIFAEAEFDIPPKLAWTFSALGEHFERLPELAAAVAEGELTYTKAREFARFIDPADQAEWIEYAKGHTNRQLERRVAEYNAKKAGREYEEKEKFQAFLTAQEMQALRAAREKAMKETDRPMPNDVLVPFLAERFLCGNGEAESTKPPRPWAALDLCPECKHAWIPVPGRNVEIKVEEWIENLRAGGEFVDLLPDFFCDCEDMLHRADECPNASQKKPAPSKRRYLPAAERRIIEARDGSRCRTPGCENPAPLEDGHLGTPHRDRGPMSRTNIARQCKVCNGFEANGDLVIVGEAPFEKYYLENGTFLGWGFDPVPFRRVSHVVESQERGKARPKRPDPGCHDPGRAAG